MAFSSNSGGGPMADINVTPLVDVMLVLLIIFMITAPVLSLKIKVDLPQPNINVTPPPNPKDPIKLKIDQSGSFYWGDNPVDEAGLKAQFSVLAQLPDPPEVQISADDAAAYQYVATVLADAKSYNLTKIGFADSQ
ncbi:ExbD/TolR family protein [Rhodanobacter sp. BL-MT-08]